MGRVKISKCLFWTFKYLKDQVSIACFHFFLLLRFSLHKWKALSVSIFFIHFTPKKVSLRENIGSYHPINISSSNQKFNENRKKIMGSHKLPLSLKVTFRISHRARWKILQYLTRGNDTCKPYEQLLPASIVGSSSFKKNKQILPVTNVQITFVLSY